jgi:hypothetical protein
MRSQSVCFKLLHCGKHRITITVAQDLFIRLDAERLVRELHREGLAVSLAAVRDEIQDLDLCGLPQRCPDGDLLLHELSGLLPIDFLRHFDLARPLVPRAI